MTHSVKLYPGKYEIRFAEDVPYLYQSPEEHTPYIKLFDDRAATETLLQAVLELDVDDDAEILKFLSSYGILINVLNNPEFPTYCGIPISKAYDRAYISFGSGIGMPKFLFRHSIKLLKDTLLLSTELSKKYNAGSDYDTDAIKKILELFLCILFQPYTLRENPTGLCAILNGITPLSCFACYYHEGVFNDPRFFSSNYLNHFIDGFRTLVINNNTILEQKRPTPGERIKESDLQCPDINTLILTNGLGTELWHFSREFGLHTISSDYIFLSYLLLSITKYCNFSFDNNDTLCIFYTNEDGFFSDTQLIEKICTLGKKLVEDTLNTYTSNIRIELSDFSPDKLAKNEQERHLKNSYHYPQLMPPMYSFTYRSKSLLQAIFYEASNLLNEYGVSICKYAKCNKTIFYKHSRPKQCCCHQHLDNYLKYQKRRKK